MVDNIDVPTIALGESYTNSSQYLRTLNHNVLYTTRVSTDQGYFQQVDDIYRILMADDRLRSAVENRVSEFIASEISFDVDDLATTWYQICPEDVLKSVYSAYVLLGWAICEIVWTNIDGVEVPKLIFHRPKHFRRDMMSGQWYFKSIDGEIEIEFGKGSWICFRSDANEFWKSSNGLWSALGELYLHKVDAREAWGYTTSKYSNVINIISAGELATEDKISKAKIDTLLTNLNSSVKRASLYLPKGYTLSMLEPNAALTWQNFDAIVKYVDDSYATLIVGSNLSTNSTSGMGSVGELQRTTNTSRLLCDANIISTQIHDELFVPYAIVNYGDATIAPWLLFKVVNDLRETRLAAKAQMLGQALSTLLPALQSGVISLKEVREFVGLKDAIVEVPNENISNA